MARGAATAIAALKMTVATFKSYTHSSLGASLDWNSASALAGWPFSCSEFAPINEHISPGNRGLYKMCDRGVPRYTVGVGPVFSRYACNVLSAMSLLDEVVLLSVSRSAFQI